MWVSEREFGVKKCISNLASYDDFAKILRGVVGEGERALRFVVTKSEKGNFRGEVLILHSADTAQSASADLFSINRRAFEDTSSFNTVLIVPTGIGSEIGGHAGDAGPLAKLFGAISDSVITHPNVVNASDINEMPSNTHYVEGSILSRLLLGTVSLQPVRNNRVLVIIDEHQDPSFTNAAINSVNGARATYGLDCPEILRLSSKIRMKVLYSSAGRATGEVSDFEGLLNELRRRRGEYDAIALSTIIDVPAQFHQKYFDSQGEMINPWGGVEAMLTHMLSTQLDVPTAHSPMFEAREIANADPGVVDSRMAAEAVSYTFLQCILKGLQRSPKVVRGAVLGTPGLIDVTNISCIVIPDKCIGLPTLAALDQGIPVIAVRENTNLLENDLSSLPWRPNQLLIVDNYLEAAGVVAAMRAGIAPASVRRPFGLAPTTTFKGVEFNENKGHATVDERNKSLDTATKVTSL